MARFVAALTALLSVSVVDAPSQLVGPYATSPAISEADMPDYELAELRDQLTGLALYIATTFEIDLDYSPESVRDVEKMLGEMHVEYRESGDFHGLNGIALEFAAYIITVIERNYEPGEWKRDHPEFGAETFPYYWRGSVIFPYAWCKKRLLDGPGDNVWSKFSVLVLDKGAEQ